MANSERPVEKLVVGGSYVGLGRTTLTQDRTRFPVRIG